MQLTSKHSSRILLASFLLVFLTGSARVLGAVTVGVHSGDWIQYGNVTASRSAGDFNQTQWLKGTVQTIIGTSVTLNALSHYTNGTEKTQIFTGDLATGSGNLTFILIPSGLGKGDRFLMNFGQGASTQTVTINNTATRSYAGASRTVDLYNSSMSSTYSDTTSTSKFLVYWDQATGLLVEISFFFAITGSCGAYCTSSNFSFSAIQTSLWGTSAGGALSSSNLLLYAGIAVVVIVAGAGGYYYLHTKKPETTPKTSPSKATRTS